MMPRPQPGTPDLHELLCAGKETVGRMIESHRRYIQQRRHLESILDARQPEGFALIERRARTKLSACARELGQLYRELENINTAVSAWFAREAADMGEEEHG